MTSFAAKPFQIHDENDLTHAPSSHSKVGKRGLGGQLAPSMGSVRPSTDKGSKIGSHNTKAERKALSSLTTSNLNARNSVVDSSRSKSVEKVELKKVPVTTVTKDSVAELENEELGEYLCSAPLVRDQDPYDIIQEKKRQILETGKFPSDDDFLRPPDDLLERDPRPTLPEINWDICDFAPAEEAELFMSATLDDYEHYSI